VVFFTVFSSILAKAMAQNIAKEASRVLKPGGAIIWYDLRIRNPRNPHTRPVRKKDIECLFPGFVYQLRAITLLPPLARRLGRFTTRLYPLLAAVPALRTHYVGVLRKVAPATPDISP
jgi:hypothetical protein